MIYDRFERGHSWECNREGGIVCSCGLASVRRKSIYLGMGLVGLSLLQHVGIDVRTMPVKHGIEKLFINLRLISLYVFGTAVS